MSRLGTFRLARIIESELYIEAYRLSRKTGYKRSYYLKVILSLMLVIYTIPYFVLYYLGGGDLTWYCQFTANLLLAAFFDVFPLTTVTAFARASKRPWIFLKILGLTEKSIRRVYTALLICAIDVPLATYIALSAIIGLFNPIAALAAIYLLSYATTVVLFASIPPWMQYAITRTAKGFLTSLIYVIPFILPWYAFFSRRMIEIADMLGKYAIFVPLVQLVPLVKGIGTPIVAAYTAFFIIASAFALKLHVVRLGRPIDVTSRAVARGALRLKVQRPLFALLRLYTRLLGRDPLVQSSIIAYSFLILYEILFTFMPGAKGLHTVYTMVIVDAAIFTVSLVVLTMLEWGVRSFKALHTLSIKGRDEYLALTFLAVILYIAAFTICSAIAVMRGLMSPLHIAFGYASSLTMPLLTIFDKALQRRELRRLVMGLKASMFRAPVSLLHIAFAFLIIASLSTLYIIIFVMLGFKA